MGQANLRGVDASGNRIAFSRRFSRETNGKLERFYGVYEQKRHQFKSIDEYVHWHNEIKPHLSLNIEADPSVPQETASQTGENRNSRTPSEITMGNHGDEAAFDFLSESVRLPEQQP